LQLARKIFRKIESGANDELALAFLRHTQGKGFLDFRMHAIALRPRLLEKPMGGAIRFEAHQNADFLHLFQRRIKFVKPADEEVADEAIKKPCVVRKQRAKAVTQRLPGLIGEKRKIERYCRLLVHV